MLRNNIGELPVSMGENGVNVFLGPAGGAENFSGPGTVLLGKSFVVQVMEESDEAPFLRILPVWRARKRITASTERACRRRDSSLVYSPRSARAEFLSGVTTRDPS
jgi:hypothetical protein